MSAYLGDFRSAKVVRKMFNTNAVAGESITMATDGTISAYKDGGTTQSTAGITFTENFDGLTGVHLVAVDTSADGTFYSAGSDFEIVLSGATIDTKAINATLFSFSLQNRSGLMPTTDGRTLDVSAGGEAGVDWANVGSPTTTLNLSGTTVKTATDIATAVAGVQADTDDIQTRLPAALVSGRIDASVGAMAANTLTATAIAADAITAAKIANGAIDAATFAAGAIDAAALATDAVAEIANGLLDLANGADTSLTVRGALRGFAAAMLGKASGLGTATAIYRDTNDTANRITATVDADGNRTSVTLDLA